MSIKTYSELITLPTFEERFEYLRTNSFVGEDTFGFSRYLNQEFYRSSEYRRVRNIVILRDQGCDLGIEGRPIYGKIVIHHINPITPDDIINRTAYALDPEYLICAADLTHKAIHYSDIDLLPKAPQERAAGDTCPWRR